MQLQSPDTLRSKVLALRAKQLPHPHPDEVLVEREVIVLTLARQRTRRRRRFWYHQPCRRRPGPLSLAFDGGSRRSLGVFDVLTWRYWLCPRTLEAAARDFLDNQNGPRVRAALADPDSWRDFGVIDWKRRIAATYGLARDYGVLRNQEEWPPDWKRRLLNSETARSAALPDGTWSPGWNRWLLSEAGPEPEIAAERILKRVSELARLRQVKSPGAAT